MSTSGYLEWADFVFYGLVCPYQLRTEGTSRKNDSAKLFIPGKLRSSARIIAVDISIQQEW